MLSAKLHSFALAHVRNEYWFYSVWDPQPTEMYYLYLGVGGKSSHLTLASQECLSQTWKKISFLGNFKRSQLDNED